MKLEKLVGSTYPAGRILFSIELGEVKLDHSRKVGPTRSYTAISKWPYKPPPCIPRWRLIVGRFTIFTVVLRLVESSIDRSEHLLHGIHHILEASFLICFQTPNLELHLIKVLIHHAWL
ncbi:hypothetical protein AMTRI_Chr06g201530 [Amborella trichopoda]